MARVAEAVTWSPCSGVIPERWPIRMMRALHADLTMLGRSRWRSAGPGGPRRFRLNLILDQYLVGRHVAESLYCLSREIDFPDRELCLQLLSDGRRNPINQLLIFRTHRHRPSFHR